MFPGCRRAPTSWRSSSPGFKKVERDNIIVVLGQTISFDAQLEIGGLTESVTVTGDSPLVDVSTTKIGTSLKGDELIAVPNSTDVWGALSEAPGVRMQGFDVGGSHKSQQSGYEVLRHPEPGARRCPTASTTPRASAAPGSTRTTTPTRKCRLARSAPTSR